MHQKVRTCHGCHTVDGTLIHGNMKAKVKKWGNSAAVRIPSSVMQTLQINLDYVMDVREESGRIVIEPIRRKPYNLDTLLKGITARNRHEPVDFGPPSGKEVW